MNRKKQAGKPAKGSAQKKVDWKALEIVHRMPLGLMSAAASMGWPSAPIATPSRYGGSDVLPWIFVRWRAGGSRKACAV